ncbi:hypothetical protein R6Q59_030602 [Mikania micrantha]
MRNNFCHKFSHLLFVVSLILIWFKVTTVTPLNHDLKARGRVRTRKCIDSERHALLDFKSYIDQDPNDCLSTWKTDEEAPNDCCSWNGVACNDKTGHVTSLDLSRGNLEGNISPSLLNLSHLNHIDLQGNSFNGSIPMFIGSMTQLRYLDLSSNLFNGSIPMFIGFITQLRYLDLSYNSFSGSIPPQLGNLTNLQVFLLNSLSNCTVENIHWLSNLSHLYHLELNGISLGKANHWVNVITSLQKLSYLRLEGCDLSQVMHSYSSYVDSNSSTIVELYLGNNNLNSSMYHWLFLLTSNRLACLDISGNKLDGIPKYFGNLCSLTSLIFDGNSMPIKFPSFLNNLSGCTSAALQVLDVSNGQFTGSLPDDIQKFTSLQELHLPYNRLNGTVSEKVWELPKLQIFFVSSNSLTGAISEKIGKSKLLNLDLSNNSLEGVRFGAQVSNLSDITSIVLSSCKLGPHFPKWIQSLKDLTYLDIANTNISDTIPEEFWNTWPSQLTHLNLSFNNITGKVTNLLSNFNPDCKTSRVDLSSNNFYGPIPYVSSSVEWLDLSRNKFYGGISFLCQLVGGSLSFLDLSNNSLTGPIPNCLWNLRNLKVLNLGQNNLSGRLPASLEHMINLEVLYLYNNSYSGELPISLKNCTKLILLELSGNKFSGHMPLWIGEKLLGLYVLGLASNYFVGTIPIQFCQLVNLRILDLSMNNLHGTIPLCVNNLTTMVRDVFMPQGNVHRFIHERMYVDHKLIKWQGRVREFDTILGLLTYIDLSSNNLTGKIPYELTDLHQLIALNLSTNALHGEIPSKISQMKELQILDLSRNKFSGRIPSSMSQMTSLDYLDVSYNNLSGAIPSGPQLQTFEPSRYVGNAGLCGLPLTKYCPHDKKLDAPTLVVGQSDAGAEDDSRRWFYIGGGTGLATGFSITCGALLVSQRGRKVFFHTLNSLEDWIYVKVMTLFISKWK